MAGLTNDMIFGAGIARETNAFNDLTMINMVYDYVINRSDIKLSTFRPGVDLFFRELNLVEFNKLDYYPRDDSFVYGAQLWWNDHLLGDMVYYRAGTGANSIHQFVYKDGRYASQEIIDECVLYLVDEFNDFLYDKADILYNAEVAYTTNRGEDMFELIKEGIFRFSNVKSSDDLSGIVFEELTLTAFEEIFNPVSEKSDYAMTLKWNDVVITDLMCIQSKNGRPLFYYDYFVDGNSVTHEVVNACARYICNEVENQRNYY